MAVASAPARLACAYAGDAAAVSTGAPAFPPPPAHLAVVPSQARGASALVHALAPAPGQARDHAFC